MVFDLFDFLLASGKWFWRILLAAGILVIACILLISAIWCSEFPVQSYVRADKPADEKVMETPYGEFVFQWRPYDQSKGPYTFGLYMPQTMYMHEAVKGMTYDERIKDPDKFVYMLIDSIEIKSDKGTVYEATAGGGLDKAPHNKFPVRIDKNKTGSLLSKPLQLDHAGGEKIKTRVHMRFFSKETGKLEPYILETDWIPDITTGKSCIG